MAINTFQYSKEVFENMNISPNWEFLLLTLKDTPEQNFVGVMFCYKNAQHNYVPELIGMDYVNSEGFHLYRQLLFQTIKRANHLKIPRIDFGISATFEKKNWALPYYQRSLMCSPEIIMQWNSCKPCRMKTTLATNKVIQT